MSNGSGGQSLVCKAGSRQPQLAAGVIYLAIYKYYYIIPNKRHSCSVTGNYYNHSFSPRTPSRRTNSPHTEETTPSTDYYYYYYVQDSTRQKLRTATTSSSLCFSNNAVPALVLDDRYQRQVHHREQHRIRRPTLSWTRGPGERQELEKQKTPQPCFRPSVQVIKKLLILEIPPICRNSCPNLIVLDPSTRLMSPLSVWRNWGAMFSIFRD